MVKLENIRISPMSISRGLKISIFITLLLFLIPLVIVMERSQLPETTLEMQERAEEFGNERGKEEPPQPFHFDGCTLFPDSLPGADYKQACLEHDIAYWYGGTQVERLEADRVFRRDVADSGPLGPVLQYPMYRAVRIMGDSPVARHFNAHWGFGYRE